MPFLNNDHAQHGPGPDPHRQHTAHDAGHHHAPGHVHGPASFGSVFAIGTGLNAAFVAAQVFYGLAAHSTALLADAIHNTGDVLGLLLAWGAAALARRRPTAQHTYGWGRGTILASLANAMLLLLGCGAVAAEAVRRFGAPAPVAGGTVAWVALAGIVVNGGTALLFMRGRTHDLNLRSTFLHMASDAAVSAGVVVSGVIIAATGWVWLDPVTSLALAAVIVVGTWGLLRDSVKLAMDAVPEGIDADQVYDALRALEGVADVHDLHVWGLSTTRTALTAHLVHTRAASATLVQDATAAVRTRFGISHATFQVETAEMAVTCARCEA